MPLSPLWTRAHVTDPSIVHISQTTPYTISRLHFRIHVVPRKLTELTIEITGKEKKEERPITSRGCNLVILGSR